MTNPTDQQKDIDQAEWSMETRATKYAEKFWGPREDLEEEEQNNFDAERDGYRAGWLDARQNPSPAVEGMRDALRKVYSQGIAAGSLKDEIETALEAYEKERAR